MGDWDRASQLSIEDWDCRGGCVRWSDPCGAVGDDDDDEEDVDDDDDDVCDVRDAISDVSLQSCNSTEALRQWTMSYPVTGRCEAVCPRRSRRRRRRRRRSCDDGDGGSDVETDVKVTYTDCDGNVCCRRQPVCSPRKPCSLVPLHLFIH